MLRIILLVTGILFIVLIGLFWYQNYSDFTPGYLDSSHLLSSVADKLGRTSHNQLYFGRRKLVLTLYPYDYVEIIFVTNKSAEEIGEMVSSFNSYLKNYQITNHFFSKRLANASDWSITPVKSYGLSFENERTNPESLKNEDFPYMTKWTFNSLKGLDTMSIELLEPTPTGAKLMYNGQVIKGNVIDLSLNIPYR